MLRVTNNSIKVHSELTSVDVANESLARLLLSRFQSESSKRKQVITTTSQTKGRYIIMKKAILVATIGAMTLGVNAGDWGKAPVDKVVIEECVDIGGEVSVGYMSNYIFYGVEFAGDSVWADVNYTFDGLAIPVTIGAWYLNGINESAGGVRANQDGYDELDLYVSAALGTFAGFDVALGYTHYIFPEFRGQTANRGAGYGEIGLDIKRSLGFVDLALEANKAFGGNGNIDGYYYQAGLEKTFGLTDNIGLVLGAGVGYSDNYFGAPGFGAVSDSGWNHYYATLSLPIQLNCRAVLTPYVGYVGAPDTWIADGANGFNPQSDILHGGVSLSVTF